MKARTIGQVAFGLGFVWTAMLACSSSTSGGGSSSGGLEAGADTSNGGPDGAAGETVSCANYCTKIAAKCTGANAMYTDDAQCQKACGFMTQGTYGDTADSVGCRQYHAGNTPLETHCPHAGPFGGDVCGEHCDAFCEIAVGACPTAFADAASCKAACAAWTRDTSTPVSSAGPTSGNTFDCRAYHLTAALQNATTHCPHIVDASPVCK
jgi:hypothetical protein